jgi:entericidin B
MRLLTVLALGAVAMAITACNTMEGAGQDLQTGGKKLERSADENKGPDSRRY